MLGLTTLGQIIVLIVGSVLGWWSLKVGISPNELGQAVKHINTQAASMQLPIGGSNASSQNGQKIVPEALQPNGK